MIPDGITPVSGWRAWRWDGVSLQSLNGVKWEPGKALHAECGQSIQQQVTNLTLSALKWHLQAPPQTYVGTASMYPSPAPSPRTLFEAYWRERLSMQRGRHGVSRPDFPVAVYDEDTGERFIPFGERSRIVVTHDFRPPDPPPDIIPNEGCSCGIYAAGSRERAERYMTTFSPGTHDPLNQGATILGRVAMWGKVVVHEDGWRAEYAYPQSFFTDAPTPALKAYGATILPTKERTGLFR